MFLTREQLFELTGWRNARRQVEWLRKMGVKHYVRRDGRPIVVAADLTPQPGPDRPRPNFAAVRPAG